MKKIVRWILALTGLGVGCLVIVGIGYFLLRERVVETRPIVLIQNPPGQSQVEVGKGLIVHATVASRTNLERIELWADNQLISTQFALKDSDLTQMVVSSGWLPQQPGKHVLIVRAVAMSGVKGQASVSVEAVDAAGPILTTHIVQEGETLETIAASYETTPAELSQMNDEVGVEGPQSGDELTVPAPGGSSSGGWVENSADETTLEEEPRPEEDSSDGTSGSPPSAEGDPPGTLEGLELLWQLFTPFHLPAEPAYLNVEVLTLQTMSSYEAVHCYARIADSDPRWVPDADFNQSTDESFTSRNSGRNWNVAEYMAGDQAMKLTWPENQPVKMTISCVGITADGTDSVKLGFISKLISPDEWGGIQTATGEGGEGRFRITYRIGWDEKDPDPSITPPWSVRLDEDRRLLHWNYLSDDGEELAIDGFAILLNDTLQWTETKTARQTRLPEEWFNLPCGDEYRFQVVAFRRGYPDGDYSLPSDSAVLSGGEIGGAGCGRSVVVTFERLTIGDLGGSLNSVYGVFYANEQQLNFDGLRVSSHTQYLVSHILRDYGSGPSQIVVELPPGRAGISDLLLWVGFDLYRDGRKICSGENTVVEERLAGHYSSAIPTNSPAGHLPDWCNVSYSVDAVADSPVVEAGSPPPLPDLAVQNLTVEPATGQLQIHVRNIGQATWAGKDVVARIARPNGEDQGEFTWLNVTLEPGETATLAQIALHPSQPLGMCVELDPHNAVEEQHDRYVEAGILSGGVMYCRPLPDLSITGVLYDQEAGELKITVQNRGETTPSSADTDGSLDRANLVVWINLSEGRPLTRVYSDFNLGARETANLTWPMGEVERERMRQGYTVSLNPDGEISELDTGNNDYIVEGSARLRLVWMVGWATFCPTGDILTYGENLGGKNTWDMELFASIGTDTSNRTVADWNSPEFEITWREESGVGWCRSGNPMMTDWFEVAGDENLTIARSADLDITGHGFRWFSGGAESLNAADDFGGTTRVSAGTEEACFADGHPYTYDYGPGIGTGGCGVVRCGGMDGAGTRQLGPIYVRGDDITGDCWWSTTYVIYREE